MTRKLITVTAGVIEFQEKILIAKRRKDKTLGGLWEFPGGKIEAGETCSQTLTREIREEFDIDIQVGEYLMEHTYAYPDFDLKMYVYKASWDGVGQIKICDHEEYQFVSLSEMDQFEFAGADYPVIDFMKKIKFMAYDTKKVSVAFLIKNKGQYLYQKRIHTGSFDGFYMLPGGHVDSGESVLSAARRELFEELGINAEQKDFIFKMVHPMKTHVVFFFEVQKYTGQIVNKEPEKHSDISFLPITHPEIHPMVKLEIQCILQQHSFFE